MSSPPQTNLLTPDLQSWLSSKIQSSKERRLVLGLAGPGGCGKTTLAKALGELFPEVAILSLDHYRLPRNKRPPYAPFGSHPDANNLKQLRKDLTLFRQTGSLKFRQYCTTTGNLAKELHVQNASLLLAEGELAGYATLDDLWDERILIRCSLWKQFKSRIFRDWRQNRQPLKKVLHVFWRSNLIEYPRYTEGLSKRASVIIDNI